MSHYGFTGTKSWIDKRSKAFFVFLTNRTYPAKEGETDQSPNDSRIHRKICDIILRSLPEYKEYFKNTGGMNVPR